MATATGGMPPLNVRIQISTTGAGTAASAMRSVAGASGAMGKSVASSAVPIRMMGDAMRQTASLIKYSVIGGFVNMGKAAMDASRQMETSLSRIKGLVGESAAQVEIYKQSILGLAGQTAKSPQELAEALYFITSAGIKGAKALDVLRESARSATAGLGDTQVVADALTSILNAYGESTYSAADANDILVATVREGKAEADQFAPALGKVLPVAAAFGATFEDVSAGVAALTRGGATAGTSAIYLRQVLSQLLKPSKQAAETMMSVGTSAEDLRQRVQEDGLLTALEYLNTQLGGNQYEIAATGLTKVFGNVRALTAVFSLLGPNLEANREIFAELNNATGDAAFAFDAAAETADVRLKSALAEVQVILVKLGDQIMPVIADLAEFGGSILRVVSSITGFSKRFGILGSIVGKFAKYMIAASAVLLLFARGALFVFTRGAALLRLFANMQIVIRGFTTGTKHASGTTRALGTSLQFSSASLSKNTALTAALKQQNAGAALSEKAFYRAVADNTTNQQLKAAALAKSAAGSATAQVANHGLAYSELVAAVNAKILGRALMTMVPIIGVVISVGMIVMDIFKGIFGKKKSEEEADGVDKRAKSLGELNKIMGVTVKLATSGFTMDVKESKDDDGVSKFEQFKKEIPQDFKDAIDQINKDNRDVAEKAALGAGFLDQLKLSDKERGLMAGYISNLLSIDSGEILAYDYSSVSTGISESIDGIFETAFQGSNKDYLDEIRDEYGPILQSAGEQLDALFGGFNTADNMGGALDDIKSVLDTAGDSVGTLVDTTGDVYAFSKSMEVLRGKMGVAGISIVSQNAIMADYQEAVLKSITDTADFTKDSKDLQTAFKETGNLDGFVKLLEKSGTTSEDARQAVQELHEAFDTDVIMTAEEQVSIFSDTLNKYKVTSVDASDATKDVMASAYNLGSEFADGLSPAIRDLVSDYEDATNAMGNFEKGQEAIKGTAVTLDDAAVDYRDSLRGLNEALKDSGGSINNSALGDKAKGAIKGVQESVLSYVNAFQVANPGATVEEVSAVAREKLLQGYGAIKQIFEQTGVDIQEGNAYLNSIKFDFTGTGVLEDYISTYFGANTDLTKLAQEVAPELPNAILEGIASGIVEDGTGAALAAQPGVKSMGDAIFQQFKDYWQIKSPSKLMKDKIGKPIIDGIVAAIVDPVSSARIRDAINSIKIQSTLSKEQLIAAEKRGSAIAAAIAKGAKGVTAETVAVVANDNPLDGDYDPNEPPKGGGGSSEATPAQKRGDAFRGGKQYGRFFGKGITRGLAEKFLEDKGKITTPVMDLIEKVIGDSSNALGTIGKYIDAQLGFQKALSENLKLANEQLLLQSNVAKAERDAAFATRKFGAQGGALVTDYEIAQIEDLQKALEKVTREYAMRRVDIRAVIDAENALNEAKAESTEVSQDVISTQNGVIDANLALKTAGLETSKSIYDVVEAQKKLTEAAIDFRINGKQAVSVFEQFADQAFPGLAYQVDEATGVMYRAGVALSDDNGLFLKSIKGLGEKIFGALATAAKEAGALSTVPEFFEPARPIDTPEDSGAGAASGRIVPSQAERANKNSPFFGQNESGGYYDTFYGAVKNLHPSFDLGGTKTLQEAKSTFKNLYDLYVKKGNIAKLASGGLVNRPTFSLIGEAGPEMVVPLNGAGVTTALERLSAVRSMNTNAPSGSREQVFNITVNNPIPETASDSISRRMRSLSTSGLFG